MKKLILLLMMFCMITIVIAPSPTLGVFKKSDLVELKQTCTINGTFCDSCNISSVDYPNGSRALVDVGYTKRSGDFNYTLDGNLTNASGTYKVNGFCQYGSDVIKNFVHYFMVNPQGIEQTEERTAATTRSIYFLIIIATVFFIGFLVFSSSVPLRLTFLIFSIIFFVSALNVLSISLVDEVVNPNLERFFEGINVIAIYFYYFMAILLAILWFLTFLNTWLLKKNERQLRNFGGQF